MKNFLSVALTLITSCAVFAQKSADTVVIELAKTSRIVFTIQDKSDLEQLRQYDFQALFTDMIARLEKKDSVLVVVESATETTDTNITEHTEAWATSEFNTPSDHENDDNDDDRHDRSKRPRTTHSFNFDLGLSNYLEGGKFPDEAGEAYAVRPWGSWYFGLNSVQRTRFGRKFYAEWALGMSLYNFKFQQDNTQLIKDNNGLRFEEDIRDVSFIKSRLGVTYLNASVVPMFSFGGQTSRKWKSHHTDFRIGAGPYAGYRVGSSTKQVYKDDDGDRQRERTRDNLYLNNLRYGVRLQIGVRSADFYFNYDMNELFAAGKGPKLNAFSFGVTF